MKEVESFPAPVKATNMKNCPPFEVSECSYFQDRQAMPSVLEISVDFFLGRQVGNVLFKVMIDLYFANYIYCYI